MAKKDKPLPLALRVPNGPAVFVGRERSLAWLAAAVSRHPVVVVAGPGGIGKSALIRHALQNGHVSVGAALHVQVRPDESQGQTRLEILRVLAKATGTKVDLKAAQRDPEECVALALEIAEAGPFALLIDDLHEEDASEADELLTQLSAYASKSRWLFTSRRAPRISELAAQTRVLAGLGPVALEDLARAVAPDVDDIARERAVARAAGSPWILHQQIRERPDDDDALHPYLGAMSDLEVEIVRHLALVNVPLDEAELTRLLPDATLAALEDLRGRGWLELGPSGWRLHDVARTLVEDHPDGSETRRLESAVAAFLEDARAELSLEAARLFADLDRIESFRAYLDDRGDALLQGGFAPRLWDVLRTLEHDTFGEWRLRCAAELGNPTALAMARRTGSSAAEGRLAWARTMLAEGDASGAAEQAEKLVAADPNDVGARVLLAEAKWLRGDSAAAGEALAGVDAANEPMRSRVLALRALVRGTDDPSSGIEPNAIAAAPEIAVWLSAALRRRGELDRAKDIARAARATPRGARARLLAGRRLLVELARIAALEGRLARALALTDEVRPYARGATILLPSLRAVDARRRILAGELGGLGARLHEWVSEAEPVDVWAARELADLRDRLSFLRADPPPGTGRWASVAVARQEGGASSIEGPIGALAEANAALHGGQSNAVTLAVRAEREAERAGRRGLRAEVVCLAIDAMRLEGRDDEAETMVAVLEHLATDMGSARFAAEAEFHRAALDAGFALETLQALAIADDVAPVASRRARAMLGGDSALDPIDERIVQKLASRVPAFTTLGPEGGRGWGLDVTRERVWLEDGTTLTLAARSLSFRILETLAARGGAATKEELIVQAWGEAEYHPLRHDPKLHVAIRKLRSQLGEETGAPSRLQTTEDGYRLRGTFRFVR